MRAQRTRECECGCGESIPARDKDGRGRRFVQGHQHHLSPVAYIVEDCGYTTPCWTWQHGKSKNGYATRYATRHLGNTRYVHVQNYVDRHGRVPLDMELDHLCRNRACVNPAHLEPVPHMVNAQRGASAKLTCETAAEVRALALAGWRNRDIAAAYGIGKTLVGDVKLGKRWSNAAGR